MQNSRISLSVMSLAKSPNLSVWRLWGIKNLGPHVAFSLSYCAAEAELCVGECSCIVQAPQVGHTSCVPLSGPGVLGQVDHTSKHSASPLPSESGLGVLWAPHTCSGPRVLGVWSSCTRKVAGFIAQSP